ncbi:MAG: hypothetical protein ACM3XN_08510 [Chloroflexota bacterium]
MRFVVRATGILADLPPFAGRGETIAVDLPGPASVRAIVSAAGVNNHLVMAVAISGQRRDKEEILTAEAELLLIPPLAGG